MKFMNDNNLFSDKQYGFITVLQLIRVLVELWTDILDKVRCVDVIYCEFMKAFDKVPHRRLLQTLENYGIKGCILQWITDFLKHRKQRVIVNQSASQWHSVLSGIPQGLYLDQFCL